MQSDVCFSFQNKAKHLVVEVVKSMLVELAMQKDKAMNLVPGQMATFLVTDGDDVLLTNPDSGKDLSPLRFMARNLPNFFWLEIQ